MSAPRKAKATFSAKARVVYRGEVQSEQFAAGAFAFAALLARMHSEEAAPPGGDDWSKRGEFIDSWIRRELGKDGDRRDGVLAAIAGFFNEYTQDVEPDLEAWQPVQFVPYVGENGREEPQAESLFFDVAGVPVSVSPDHVTHRWDQGDCLYYSIDIARTIGKPISRRKFDAMRRQAETASSGGEE